MKKDLVIGIGVGIPVVIIMIVIGGGGHAPPIDFEREEETMIDETMIDETMIEEDVELIEPSSFFGGVTDGVTDEVDVEKQSLDRLQEKINQCNTLSDDGGFQSPSVKCGVELIPELIEFCEKYPNSVLDNSSCAEVLESADELKRLELALNP